jgi:hypothetical protein
MHKLFSRKRRRLLLSARVSLLLMLAALLPLMITIFVSELFSRPALIAQANASMEADAGARVQTIANFFSQPIIDVTSLSRDTVLTQYLSGNNALAADATRVLATGYQRNTNYLNWSLIDAQGKQRLFYPEAAHPHGKYFIPPDMMQQSNTPNGALSSPAYYNPQGNVLTVDLSEPVTVVDGNTTRVIGFVRATLNVSFIWNIIVDERGVNGNGSYAFIVDENGVIIAHTDMKQAFSAIAPFTVNEQQDINTQQYYGGINIPVRQYGTLGGIQQSAHPQTSFQMVPPGQTTLFSVISRAVPIVPWTYFVLSPTDVVTALADQQLLITGIIASVVLCLAAVTGLTVGRSITSPILDSVMKLQSSSQSLKELADNEQVAATQQIWVVDASKTGLTTIDYYTGATQIAAQRLIEIGAALQRRWPDVNLEEVGEAFTQVMTAARYIENAVRCQKTDSMKLSDTIDLTKQVTEQLASSAESATQAADQMERVVSQLQHVVGKE